MSQTPSQDDRQPQIGQFEREADRKQPGLLAEFVQFLAEEKKWWLTPILLVLLLLGLIVVAGSTGAAPFIYTMF